MTWWERVEIECGGGCGKRVNGSMRMTSEVVAVRLGRIVTVDDPQWNVIVRPSGAIDVLCSSCNTETF